MDSYSVLFYRVHIYFHLQLTAIQRATVVVSVSTVRKSVIARTIMRTVRIIHQKVDVSRAVLHPSRDPLVKVLPQLT